MHLYSDFQRVAQKYGFKARCGSSVQTITYGEVDAPVYTIMAKNTDNHWVTWFSVIPDMGMKYGHEAFLVGNNTDVMNIWLHETRKDLTPENCVMFFAELNAIFNFTDDDMILLKDWIDSEDWQEIAGVHDASCDPRYTDPNWKKPR